MGTNIEYFFYRKLRGGARIVKLIHFVRLSPYVLKEKLRAALHPRLLVHFEKKYFSQNGEDGVLEEIFRRIGVTNRFCVEFGVENGDENNTVYLLKNKGWSGLWIEASDVSFENAKKNTAGLGLKILNSFVTRANILDLFKAGSVPEKPDLVCVDIDGNDYWITEKILSVFTPRVLCVEINSKFGPAEDFVVEYRDDFRWDGSDYFGASLRSYTAMLVRHGYALVGCDSAGVNAFYIRKEELNSEFLCPVGDPVKFFYTAPKYGLFFGHPGKKILGL